MRNLRLSSILSQRQNTSQALYRACRYFATGQIRQRPGSPSSGPGSSSSSSAASSIASSPSSSSKQRARDWFFVTASGGGAVLGAWWYLTVYSAKPTSSNGADQQRSFSITSPSRTTFAIPVRSGSDRSKTEAKLIQSLLPDEVTARLRENEKSTKVERPAGACIVDKYETNSLASNDPIEDRRAEVIVERDRAVEGVTSSQKGDLGFFAVMDGHAGYHTSHLLSNKLIAFVALELDKVIREAGEYGEIARSKAAMPAKLWKMLFGGPEAQMNDSSISSSGLDGDAEIVKRAIVKAFRGLDKEIVNTPIELLKEYELARDAILGSHKSDPKREGKTGSLSSLAQSIFPISQPSNSTVSTATQKSAHETMLPAMSGSCALLTYVDSARGHIYVACTGDSRAVAGWWDEDKQQWSVEPLSRDQTGRNPDEAKRMRAEHPSSESEHVIMRGRVLGGLEPTRAFGDARYKWSRNLQERLYDAFLPGGRHSVRGAPNGLLTPPYVTAEPVVEWRKISSTGPKELKFIIMATDGLWDELSNEQAAGLVATHMSGFRGVLGASELHSRCFEANGAKKAIQEDQAKGVAVQQQTKQTSHPLHAQKEASFVFEDENLATHLTRNALGGANRERVAGLLAIPAPLSRRYRDDITINVLLFNTRQGTDIIAEAGNATHAEQIKAKL